MSSLNTYEELVALIGLDATVKVCAKWGSEVMYIPSNGSRIFRKKRNAIIKMAKEGKSAMDIARSLGLESSTVIDIVEDDSTYLSESLRISP